MIIFRLTCLVGYPRTSAPEPNKLSILVKNVEKRTSLTGKFLTFLKEGIIEKSSDSSMHEQKAGTIFRDDDMLIENDTVEMDSIIID